jgi:FdrA protein
VTDRVEIRRGTFLDSVALMIASNDARALEGVEEASIVNATPLNVELVERQGFSLAAAGDDLGPSDLVIAIRGESDEALERALGSIEERLHQEQGTADSGAERPPARSLSAAVGRRDDLDLALISVPGQHATYECARALDAGLDVLCFSSGPPISDEVGLKRRALDLGRMMMGPDCGTAILGGVSLGFGNATRPGPVGIVGASGTGIQAITCLLDAAGVGISHAIGVGGRDLWAEVGGIMAIRGIELLADDPATETILVVAKSPAPEVAERVASAARESGKTPILAFPGLQGETTGGVEHTGSLEEAAARAARIVGSELPRPEPLGSVTTSGGSICGLYSGGTLRDEAKGIIAAAVGEVGSEPDESAEGRHVLVDLGDERFTQGRAHPMIDFTLRTSILDQRSRDPGVGVLLADIVLGYGANPDPAGELAPAIEAALARRGDDLAVVIALCGTAADHQGLEDQAERLHGAGAVVTRSNAEAARLALRASGHEGAGE